MYECMGYNSEQVKIGVVKEIGHIKKHEGFGYPSCSFA